MLRRIIFFLSAFMVLFSTSDFNLHAKISCKENIAQSMLCQTHTDQSDLALHLKKRLTDLSFLSKKSKNFASRQDVIDMFETVIALEKEICNNLTHSSRDQNILSLYNKAIRVLRTTKVTNEFDKSDSDKYETVPLYDQPDVPDHTNIIDQNTATVHLEKAIEEFHTNNCLFFIKKTTVHDTILRIGLKSFVQIGYNLASYHRKMPDFRKEDTSEKQKKEDNPIQISKTFNYKKLLEQTSLRMGWNIGQFFIDEALPKQSLSWKQAIAELVVPLFIGALATTLIVKSDNWSKLAYDSFFSFFNEALRTLFFTSFYLNKHEFPKLISFLKTGTYTYSFFLMPILELNKEPLKFLLLELKSLTYMLAPNLMNKIQWPAKLNPKHRKALLQRFIMSILAASLEAGFHSAKEAGHLDLIEQTVFEPMKTQFNTFKKKFKDIDPKNDST